MSSRTAPSDDREVREAIEDLQNTAEEIGHPPSRHTHADLGDHHPNVIQRIFGTDRWAEALGRAGLRARRECTFEAIARAERDERTWTSSSRIESDHALEHISAQDIGHVLNEIADDPGWGLTAEPWSDSHRCWWVHLVDEPEIVTDGGTDEIPSCPGYDSSQIQRSRSDRGRPCDHGWKCVRCGAVFDEAVWRERRLSMPEYTRSSHANALIDADPDIVTDGGVEEPTRPRPQVDNAGYPRDVLNDLVSRSEREFVNALSDHPEGDNWSDMDPAELLSRAREHLDQAEGDVSVGNVRSCRKQTAHALNFALFAMDAAPTHIAATDGGIAIESADDGIGPQKAVLEALRDGPRDGLHRTDLVERAAALGRATRADVEDAVDDLKKYGEIYVAGEALKITAPQPSERNWGGFS